LVKKSNLTKLAEFNHPGADFVNAFESRISEALYSMAEGIQVLIESIENDFNSLPEDKQIKVKRIEKQKIDLLTGLAKQMEPLDNEETSI